MNRTESGEAKVNGSQVRLRDKVLADAHNDYVWQSDRELARLVAVPHLDISFIGYLTTFAAELIKAPVNRRQFAITTLDGKHIGNCVYYGIDEEKGEAELGIMIGDRDCWSKGYGADAVNALLGHIFDGAGLKKVYLKTLLSNTRARWCFQKCGFTLYGQISKNGHDFMLMEIRREDWLRQVHRAQAGASPKSE